MLLTLPMDFQQHHRNDEECSICLDDTLSLANLNLSCGHWYHVQCLRQRVQYIRRNNSNAKLYCPLCGAEVASDLVDGLWHELRNLSYRCTLPLYLCRYPTTPVRVVFQKEGDPNSEFFSDIFRIRDLPPDPNRPRQVLMVTDLEITVTDPEIRYRAWIENANTGLRLTTIQRIKTTSTDDPEDDERDPLPVRRPTPPLPRQEPVDAILINPAESPARRRRRMQPRDPILVAQRRQRRIQRREELDRAQQYLLRAVRLLEEAVLELRGNRNSTQTI